MEMDDKLTTEQKWEIVKEKSLFCSPYYGTTKYAGAKRMTQILKQFNTAIKACWELHELYDNSELENQHKHEVSMDEIADIALKLEDMRNTLFCDSLNYNRILKFAELEVDEIDRLEHEIEEERNRRNDDV